MQERTTQLGEGGEGEEFITYKVNSCGGRRSGEVAEFGTRKVWMNSFKKEKKGKGEGLQSTGRPRR